MICKPDNKKTFTEEQPYSVKCEACDLFCKIDKYRSCADRHEWNRQQGIDVFAALSPLDRVARMQQGSSDSSTIPNQANRPLDRSVPRPKSRHRGRK